jgi:phosphoribosylamine-glycine ligase
MVLFMSVYGESAPIAYRMQKEGTPVYFYLHEPHYKCRFDGILDNKVDVSGMTRALNKCEVVVFDITQHNRGKSHDKLLLNKFGIPTSQKDLFGSIADKLKKDKLVIGASQLGSELEWNREAGIKLAGKLGLDIPDYQVFKTVKDGIKFLESTSGSKSRWVLKPWDDDETEWTYCEKFQGEMIDILKTNILRKFGPNFKFMLQQFIDGVEYATEMWQDITGPVFYTRTLECKKLSDGNMSKATGSQLNTYWITKTVDKKLDTAFKKLWKHADDGYIGMTDINCIYNGNKRYFLEFTRRFGWSSTYLACSLVPEHNLSTFFIGGFKAVFKPQIVSSQAVSLWPYPGGSPKELEENIKGNLINHPVDKLGGMWLQDVYLDETGLRCAGSDGFIGVQTGMGAGIEQSIDDLYKRLDKLEITGNTQWRTKDDHLHQVTKRLKRLKDWGVETF